MTPTEIYNIIKANRDERNKNNNNTKGDLSSSSFKKYTNSVNSIYKQLGVDEPMTPAVFIKHIDKVKSIINNAKTLSTAHAYAVAMFVFTNDAAYNALMMEKSKEKEEQVMKRERTEKQKKNWITKKEIHKKLNDLEKLANAVYEKHSLGQSLNDKDYQDIQDFILVLVSCDKYLPLRRSLDWCAFKISDINLEADNYITEDGAALVFNTYKTAAAKGKQVLHFNKYKYRNNTDWDFYSKKGAMIIKRELLRWIAINPTEYLFFTTKFRKPLSAYNITNWFNRIFEQNVSTNMLRNILMTDRHEKIINQFEQAKRAMSVGGSSASMLMNYVKDLMKT